MFSGSAGVNPAFAIVGLLLVFAWRNAGWTAWTDASYRAWVPPGSGGWGVAHREAPERR